MTLELNHIILGMRNIFNNKHLPSLPPSLPLPPAVLELAGIGVVSVPLQQRRVVGLQAHAAAYNTCQSQGPALLSGEREIHQPLPFPLQELSQIDFIVEKWRAVQASGEITGATAERG